MTGPSRSGPCRRIGVVALVCASVVTGCASSPPPPNLIGAGEAFRGLVNGTGDGAQITTVCPGPTWPGRQGRALQGQILSATRDPSGPGNTGDNGAVFVGPNGSMQVTQLRAWDEAVPFPPDIDVPCDGTGTIVFDPCFGFVGCRGGAQPDVVSKKETLPGVCPGV